MRKQQLILSFRAERGIPPRFMPMKKREIPRFARNDKMLEMFSAAWITSNPEFVSEKIHSRGYF
jgi:hypothetical protein